jgi:hypothetical protein
MVEAHVEEPDPIDSLRLLRGGERRGEETASNSRDEGPTVHHSIT